jgi:uncharacterized OB-fold protein/acyl dehydratase
MNAPSLAEQLASYVGLESNPAYVAADPVNAPMIRHLVEVLGDENPVYVDEHAARQAGFDGIVAPATMLQVWTMPGWRPRGLGGRYGELLALLDEHGFTSVVATDCEQEYFRPLVVGDRLEARAVIESVSSEKQTSLGAGYFVTTHTEFRDQSGALVGTMRFRILKFRPRRSASPEPPTARVPPAEKGAEGTSAAQAGRDAATTLAVVGGAPDVQDRPARAPRASARAVPGTEPQREVGPRRPRPSITKDNAFFFEGTRGGKLLLQRCAACSTLRHPPTPSCPACRSLEWEAVEASGRGTIHSYVVVHHPQVAGFDYPLPIALVELEEGVRLVANLEDVEPQDVQIGMPVRARIVAFDEELALPVFRPAEDDPES